MLEVHTIYEADAIDIPDYGKVGGHKAEVRLIVSSRHTILYTSKYYRDPQVAFADAHGKIVKALSALIDAQSLEGIEA